MMKAISENISTWSQTPDLTKSPLLHYSIVFGYNGADTNSLDISYDMFVKRGNDNDAYTQYLLSPSANHDSNFSTQFDRCLYYSGRCLYPLELIKDNNDGRLAAVKNHNEIKQRWEKIKKWISYNFEGEVVDKLAEQVDGTLARTEYITQAISNSLFFQLYFFPLYNRHTQSQIVALKHSLTLVPNSPPVLFQCERSFNRMEYGTTGIHIEGVCIDNRSYTDIVYSKVDASNLTKEDTCCNGKIMLDYTLNIDEMVRNVTGQIEITDEEDNYTQVSVDIQFIENELSEAAVFTVPDIPSL